MGAMIAEMEVLMGVMADSIDVRHQEPGLAVS